MDERFGRIWHVLNRIGIGAFICWLGLMLAYFISGDAFFINSVGWILYGISMFCAGGCILLTKAEDLHYECKNGYAAQSTSCNECWIKKEHEWHREWALSEYSYDTQEERDARTQQWTGESAARVIRKAPVKTS